MSTVVPPDIPVDMNKPAKAIFTISVMVAEPLEESKQWRPVLVDNTSLSVNLVGHNHQELAAQIRQKLEEFKKLWGTQIISLESLPTDAEANQSRTEDILS